VYKGSSYVAASIQFEIFMVIDGVAFAEGAAVGLGVAFGFFFDLAGFLVLRF
jgi:hypothetical protein